MVREEYFVHTEHLLQKTLKRFVKNLYNVDLDDSELIDVPRDRSYGDFSSNVAFRLAKKLRKNPQIIAEEIVNALTEHPPLLNFEPIFTVYNLDGFVNFRLSFKYKLWLIKKLYTSFGLDRVLMQSKAFAGKKIVVEYASPNPNKAMHLGHFRNIAIAIPLVNMFKLLGAKVFTDMVLNDKGIAISKAMVGYLAYGKKTSPFDLPKDVSIDEALDVESWFHASDLWLQPSDVDMEPGKFVDKFYVLGSKLVKENETAARIAQLFVRDWEIENPAVVSLWELIISWAVESQLALFKRLGAKFDTVWRESDHYLLGKQIVQKALRKGLLKLDKKSKKGAIVADLEKENLGKFVLIRSDGTSLYSTQDVALTKLKIQRYHANEYYWVVGAEQSYYFKQLFETLKKIGIVTDQKLVHIGYALLLSGGKKASSRSGEASHLIDFLNNIKNYIREEFNLSEDDAQKLGDFIARVAVLKVGANRDYNFNIKAAAEIKGHTGAYLMYSYVRAKQILQKYDKRLAFSRWLFNLPRYFISTMEASESTKVLTIKDVEVVNILTMFRYYLEKAARLLDPAVLVSYAFELADTFNSYYEAVPILRSAKLIREFRLYLVHAVVVVLDTIIQVLGGVPIEKM